MIALAGIVMILIALAIKGEVVFSIGLAVIGCCFIGYATSGRKGRL